VAGAIVGGAVGGIVGGALGRGPGAFAGAAIGATTGAVVAAEAQAQPGGYYWWRGACYSRYPNGAWSTPMGPHYRGYCAGRCGSSKAVAASGRRFHQSGRGFGKSPRRG